MESTLSPDMEVFLEYANNTLFVKRDRNMATYLSNTEHSPNHFVLHANDGPELATGVPATVSVVNIDTFKVTHGGGQFYGEETPDDPTFRETLAEWDGDWMWEGLNLPEDMSWIADAMLANTLIGVTYGLYDRKKGPNIIGAGGYFIAARLIDTCGATLPSVWSQQAATEASSLVCWRSTSSS
ncbi:hypothetical protein ACHAXR_009989 [Thalassiosira sp. AJA248-18]